MQCLYSYNTIDKKIPEMIFSFLPRFGVSATDEEILNLSKEGGLSEFNFFFFFKLMMIHWQYLKSVIIRYK